MKIIIGMILGFFIAMMPLVVAQETAEASSEDVLGVQAGATPDSWTYGFKRFFENAQLWFTFDPEAKAKLKYKLAQIRLAEAALMAEKNKTQLALRAIEEYENGLSETNQDAERLAAIGRNATELRELVGNATYKHVLVLQRVWKKVPEQAKAAIERNIERALERHSQIAERFDKEPVNMTISIGNRTITRQVPAKLAEQMLEKASELRKKFRQEVNITDRENLAEKIAEKIEIRKEKAEEKINDAREAIADAESKVTGTNITAAEKLLNQSRTHLEKAETAFANKKYGEAFAQAIAAENQANNAKRLVTVKEKVAEIRETIKEKREQLKTNKTQNLTIEGTISIGSQS